MASLGAVLEQYPNEVMVFVTDPRTGIQRRCKWPPTIAEIVEACDARVAELDRMKRFENWGASNALLLDAPRENRPTLEQMREKYGPNWGLTPHETRKTSSAPSWDAVAAAYHADPTRLARLMKAANYLHPDAPDDQHPAVHQEVVG